MEEITIENLADDYAVAYSDFMLSGAKDNKECVIREKALHDAITAVILAEREACATICEEYDPTGRDSSVLYIKRAIRKRSNV